MTAEDVSVSVRGVSKAYTINRAERRDTLFHTALDRLRDPLGRSKSEEFWALRDVEFDVARGEVVGIIGRNGAGKSTLLKMLSRITEPTAGEIDLYGRVGSLLEVGTGFHPELSGRENIYLNGQILGMRRGEIDRQFDAIVDFAGVEKFIDTPVKRYSSGMYVRLAFAVAAHLEPEILIVDEVLAVGDLQFQEKCLGKMREVSRQDGRTVLFVSHNLGAVRALCDRAVALAHGRVTAIGRVHEVVSGYLQAHSGRQLAAAEWAMDDAPGDAEVKLLAMRAYHPGTDTADGLSTDKPIAVEVTFHCAEQPHELLCAGFELRAPDGSTLLWSYQTDGPRDQWPQLRAGTNRIRCLLPPGLLNGGVYGVAPKISVHNQQWHVNADVLLQLNVRLAHGVSPTWAALSNGARPGGCAPVLTWAPVP